MMKLFLRIRYVTILTVVAAFFGAVLMFVNGAYETLAAYRVFLGLQAPTRPVSVGLDATVKVLTSLDSFMFGLVLLYFAYSVFFLFIHQDAAKSRVRVPEWLQVQGLEQMKRTILEVIIVLLAVLFLIIGLENQSASTLNWNLVLIPLGILAVAGAIKLIDVVPDQDRPRGSSARETS